MPTAYLPRHAWALVPVSACLSAAVAAGTALLWAFDQARPDWTVALWPAVAVAVAVAVRAIQRQVLQRPQPLAEPDVIAADDAIRSRSLHVLAGGGTALILLCVYAQLGAAQPVNAEVHRDVELIRGFGVFVIAAIGWNVATWPWTPRAPQRGNAVVASAP